MQYREHRVPAALDALVECVWFLTTGTDKDGGPFLEIRRVIKTPGTISDDVQHPRTRFGDPRSLQATPSAHFKWLAWLEPLQKYNNHKYSVLHHISLDLCGRFWHGDLYKIKKG